MELILTSPESIRIGVAQSLMALASHPPCVFGNVVLRMSGTADDPHFCVKDVCAALSIRNGSQKLRSVDPVYVSMRTAPTAAGDRQMAFVSESGFYELIFTCRKRSGNDVVQRFRKWVFGSVLPSIRRTGAYDCRQQEYIQSSITMCKMALDNFADDDGLRLLANARLKNMLSQGQTPVADRLLPVTVRLEQAGFSARDIRPHRSTMGRQAAAMYRQQFHREPRKSIHNVEGYPCSVKVYSEEECAVMLPRLIANLRGKLAA